MMLNDVIVLIKNFSSLFNQKFQFLFNQKFQFLVFFDEYLILMVFLLLGLVRLWLLPPSGLLVFSFFLLVVSVIVIIISAPILPRPVKVSFGSFWVLPRKLKSRTVNRIPQKGLLFGGIPARCCFRYQFWRLDCCAQRLARHQLYSFLRVIYPYVPGALSPTRGIRVF